MPIKCLIEFPRVKRKSGVAAYLEATWGQMVRPTIESEFSTAMIVEFGSTYADKPSPNPRSLRICEVVRIVLYSIFSQDQAPHPTPFSPRVPVEKGARIPECWCA